MSIIRTQALEKRAARLRGTSLVLMILIIVLDSAKHRPNTQKLIDDQGANRLPVDVNLRPS